MRSTILLIEDDKSISELIEQLLLDNDYSVITAYDGATALNLIPKKRPDLAIVDLGLPKISGESVCKEIEKRYPDMPFIILTAKSEVSDILKGFNMGAQDYITKPFELDVLLARINARLKNKVNNQPLTVEDLSLDNKTFQVKRQGKPISLSQKEFQLLEYLMTNKGHVLTRDMILQKVWLSTDYIEPRVVDVYIGYLRRKIDHSSKNKLIHTLRGFGYVIKPSAHS